MRPIKRYEDTAARLTAANRIYPAGWEIVESDTGRYKACNGLTAWNSLPYSETAATAAAIASAVAALLATTITNGDTTHAPDGNSVFDALAGKLDTSAIASSISNGDTTHAPDGNSVFDALAAKVDGTAGVKVYRALVAETGGDAPVSTVLENSLGGVPAWSAVGTGTCELTLAGVWTADKTFVTLTPGTFNDRGVNGINLGWERTSANVLTFYGHDLTQAQADWETVGPISLEILVYP